MDDAAALELAKRAAFRGGRVALAKLGDPGYLTWKGQRDVVTCGSGFDRVRADRKDGVVYDPIRDETFAATLGAPATLNNRPITVLNTALGPEFWEQAWVATDLPPSGPRREIALRIFGVFAREVLQQYVWGSPALALCYVAAGRIHAYWTLDAKPWDVAAACVILPSAGGLITDADGGSWLHSDGSYVAANPASHQWALRGIKFVREQARQSQPR